MYQEYIINNMQKYLRNAQLILANLLNKTLPQIPHHLWWERYINEFPETKRNYALQNINRSIKEYDLQTLIRIASSSWDLIQTMDNSCKDCEKKYLYQLRRVRNNWSHCPTIIDYKDSKYSKKNILKDLYTLQNFFRNRKYTNVLPEIKHMIEVIETEIKLEKENPIFSQFSNDRNKTFTSQNNKHYNQSNTKRNNPKTHGNTEKSEDKDKKPEEEKKDGQNKDDCSGCAIAIVIAPILYLISKVAQ